MKKKEKDFYEAVNAYNIPVLTLDHNWHKLFGNEEATPAVKVLQEELNELLKKQGRAATEGKKTAALKKKLMEEIIPLAEQFRDDLTTYFVLDNLDTLRKNGRLSRVKAFVASTLAVKPVMGSTDDGNIVQRGQAIGMKKALVKMADIILGEKTDLQKRTLMITHCNCPDKAEKFKEIICKKADFRDILIMDTAGVSSMYANDGGIIVTV